MSYILNLPTETQRTKDLWNTTFFNHIKTIIDYKLTLAVPCISENCIEIKIEPQRSMEMKIVFFPSSEIRTGGLRTIGGGNL